MYSKTSMTTTLDPQWSLGSIHKPRRYHFSGRRSVVPKKILYIFLDGTLRINTPESVSIFSLLILTYCFELKELQEFWKIILPSESLTLVRTRMEKILKLHKSFTTRVPSSSTSSEEHRPNSVWNKYRRVLAESMDFVKPENSGLSSELELGLSRTTRSSNQNEIGTKSKTIGK